MTRYIPIILLSTVNALANMPQWSIQLVSTRFRTRIRGAFGLTWTTFSMTATPRSALQGTT